MKVLTVDDSKTIRAVVSHYLTPLGMTVLQASDGLEGLELLRSAKPDLAIIDVAMPNLDGISLLGIKAREPAIAAIPVIMLTAGANQEFVLKCMRQGAKGFIVKPFEKKTLVNKVCKALKIEPPAEPLETGRAGAPVILAVIREEPELATLTEILLEGCEVLNAMDLRLALKLARERRPESIWLDLSLPQAEVEEFVGTLRAEGKQEFLGIVPRGTQPPAFAAKLGIKALLPRPFIRVEVSEFAARHLGVFQRFLKEVGDICVLQIPGDTAARVKDWQPALDQEIRIGLERASAHGVRGLVLDFSRVTGPADVTLVSGAVSAVKLGESLGLQVMLSVNDEDTLRSFANYADLKGVRCSRSVADSVEALGRAAEGGEPKAA